MSDLSSTFLVRLDTIIENNLHDEAFSIEILCKELATSYTHTYRRIREETGLSPSMYVCKKRLELACKLLEASEMNIGEISFRVGFNTQAYFSKCFSEQYGCSPLRYRKHFRKGEDAYALVVGQK